MNSSAQAQTLADAFRLIVANNVAEPRVYVHRDYHSRNLMVSDPNPGVLDFQDAVVGPITTISCLLRDAYIAWDEELQIDWAVRYWERARQRGLPVRSDFGAFWRDFEWMGVQRQLKVLGIFARLYHRDGKAAYLDEMPRVMSYLRGACARYRALGPLAALIDELEDRAPVTVAATASSTLMSRRPEIGAMILAAGRGERMRRFRRHAEGALLEAGGKALLAADRGARAGRLPQHRRQRCALAEQVVAAFGDRGSARRDACLVARARTARSRRRNRDRASCFRKGPALIVSGITIHGIRLTRRFARAPKRWPKSAMRRACTSSWSATRTITRRAISR